MPHIQAMKMLKSVSENMELSRESDCGRAPLDIEAAASLKNVLFFFSLVFRYPREAVHEEIGRLLPLFDDFFDAFAGDAPEFPEVVELQAEYIRLFVNSRVSVPVVPYASWHLDGGGLMGESYHRLCRIMGKTGFVLDESVGELEDHLAVLLEFASMLTDRLIEASAPGGGPLDEMMNIFGEVILQYVRPLVETILAGVSESAKLDFYTVSARALFNFLTDAEEIYEYVFGVSLVAALNTGVKK